MKTLSGLIIGLLLGLILGFGAGYNHGRGAPVLSNPFAPYDAGSRLERTLEEFMDETRRAIHKATEE
ncbi:hypothetical protein [Alkalilimnicola sp. S0819]|uniref:hypothetical protein n=1 Tax=Alkalilimnicola sp. S0819 TaxID=2613922 RepID=UPI001261EF94|nr:hypothetical protein [Alkalilimnicola sp. S0819]KAB7627292.1 hypothetical protein F3N43_05090 [Alkalilimnicola sp. S0819]MPQ16005.1 hypothetical protein [Alkalilimnicola sp. S0819]